ncbi:MAG: 2-C-methyl-D-erythritol 4-phosphate cytidylyltransferase [Ruminococcaceae bacterium]|nr:2-C-methyl-D-erythritol 4-phosphate cytidylyltransferase [Oscillospiraceae bacterium]
MKRFVSAIIAASGNSTRMGLSISKQLIKINGKPTIEHTLSAFENSEIIDEIIVVCRQQDIDSINEIAEKFSKVKAVVTGGVTRADSVKNGVMAATEDAQFFAIHDGARPLITPDDIKRVVECAFETGGATLGTFVTDTIKVVDDSNVILSTPVRETLRAVQTPQVFKRELYLRAIDNAVKNNLSVTDDCSMVEALGEKVEIVLGSVENIKLTTVTDLSLASAILDNRK